MIKLYFNLALALAIFGGGAYVGWHSHATYSEVTSNPLGFIAKLAGGK